MALSAGRLRHRVEIQFPATTQNPTTGEMTVSWQTLAFVWAAVEPASAKEFMAASAEQSEVGGKVIIRRRADVDATMRIIHRDMAYQILGVLSDPVSGLEYLTLPVAQGVRIT